MVEVMAQRHVQGRGEPFQLRDGDAPAAGFVALQTHDAQAGTLRQLAQAKPSGLAGLLEPHADLAVDLWLTVSHDAPPRS